jgi:putative ABC transport system permease protein
MRTLRALTIRIVSLFRRTSSERELSAEIQSHLDLHIADNVRTGMTGDEARRRALISLGGVEQTKERHRERRTIRVLDEVAQDTRFAARLLVKDRGFTLTAVLVLALGIGANAAIFSVVDALVLRPLPYREPDRLVMVWEDAREIGFPNNTPAPGNYFSWKERNRTLSGLAATRSATANLTRDGQPEFVTGRRVTANFFDVLGVQPAIGRAFTEEEDRNGEPVTVISYSLWQRRFAGAGDILGKSIVMNGERRAIVGVMPPEFVFRNREIDFWTPIRFTQEQATLRTSHFLNVVGRLAPGRTAEEARQDIAGISEQLKREYPRTNGTVGSVVKPLREDLLGDTRTQLVVLMGAAACVLLIACANVAGLLLLRAVNRRGELAVRASLGATSGRIARQLVAEAMMVALTGAVFGIMLAPAGVSLLSGLVPMAMFPVGVSVTDPRLLMVGVALAVIAGIAFSLLPAIHAGRSSILDGLQHAGRSRIGGPGVSRDVLVVSQLATAVVLLVGTGLLLRTFTNLRGVELGFQPNQLLTIRTTLPLLKYSDDAGRRAFFDRVVGDVRSLPGVQDAAYVSNLPFGSIGNTTGYILEGRPDREDDALMRIGTPDYLKTIGAQLVEGRLPDARDQANMPLVVVVSETFARLNWPAQSAVGRRVTFGGPDAPSRAIVGVIRDVRERGYQPEAKSAAYIPSGQWPGTTFLPETLVVRGSGNLDQLIPAIRRVIANVDPEQPLTAIRTMQEVLDLNVVDRRQQAVLLGIFAGVAVLLAALGLYGLLAYAVTQRKQEIAVRMAMGASAGSVLRGVAVGGQKRVAVGLAIGLATAWGLARGLETQLYRVTPTDSFSFAAAGGVLWLVALLACCIPALKAARVNPASLLRGD